jgi:hypothetical protein
MMSLSENEKRRLALALGTTLDGEFEARLEQLKEVALDELVDWILARRRFDSISAIDRHRVLQIFGAIRKEAPTVQALVEQIGISESRAVSLLSRLRYGEARTVRALMITGALREIEEALGSAGELASGRKFIWVSADTGRMIDEANTAIMLDHAGRASGGRFEGAEKAERAEASRTGQAWSTTTKMWNYITTVLGERLEVLEVVSDGGT